MKIVDEMCKIEEKRLNNLKIYIDGLTPKIERKGLIGDFIILEEGKTINDTSKVSNIPYSIRAYLVNNMCSIFEYRYENNNNQYTMVDVSLSNMTLINRIKNFSIDENFRKYLCERAPLISIGRFNSYLVSSVLNYNILNGKNKISSIRYHYDKNDEIKALEYLPNDQGVGKSVHGGTLNLKEKQFSIYSKDLLDIPDDILQQLLLIVFQGEPRNVTKILGYYKFSDYFNKWCDFLDKDISNTDSKKKLRINNF